MKIILLQPSLRKNSLTSEILQEFQNLLVGNEYFRSENYEIKTIDLREIELEFCDGRDIKDYNRGLQDIFQEIQKSDMLIIWFPVYHYALSWVLKNFLDIVGDALKEKKLWVIVSALLSDCDMAYEHFFESFAKKYNITRISEVPYILNSDFHNGKLGLIWKWKLQKFVKAIL